MESSKNEQATKNRKEEIKKVVALRDQDFFWGGGGVVGLNPSCLQE